MLFLVLIKSQIKSCGEDRLAWIMSNTQQFIELFGTAKFCIFTHLGIRKVTEASAQGFKCTL